MRRHYRVPPKWLHEDVRRPFTFLSSSPLIILLRLFLHFTIIKVAKKQSIRCNNQHHHSFFLFFIIFFYQFPAILLTCFVAFKEFFFFCFNSILWIEHVKLQDLIFFLSGLLFYFLNRGVYFDEDAFETNLVV